MSHSLLAVISDGECLIPVPLTMGKTDQLKIMDQTAVSLESSYCIVLAP